MELFYKEINDFLYKNEFDFTIYILKKKNIKMIFFMILYLLFFLF